MPSEGHLAPMARAGIIRASGTNGFYGVLALDKKTPAHKQSPFGFAVAGVTLAFAVLISLFAIRNNDIWWLLAVGRRIIETKSFIRQDPFTFSAAGTPWAPQAYLSALVFYVVHQTTSAVGLIVLRVLLVLGIFAVSYRTLSRLGISWLAAAPVVLLVMLNAHSRFILRAHLFEYLFVALLVGFLLTAHNRKGKSFFVFPVLIQLFWVNMHPSFLLGPAFVVLFYLGEWAGGFWSKRVSFIRPFDPGPRDWRRIGILVVLMAAACFVNPAPGLFLTQPLGAEQRELLSRFTLEWRSPFDPALSAGAFHPYYEILLGLAVLSMAAAITRLPLAPVILLVVTAYMSLQAHRFRVEFALVALPVIFILLQASPLSAWVRRKIKKTKTAGVLAGRIVPVAAVLILIATAWDRVSVGTAVADRYPDKALEFVRIENVAFRPFTTIGFGSYLVWDLYGERQSFIDGRNFSPVVYQDFLMCQSSPGGPAALARKYQLDSFIIPPQESADAGIKNIHKALAGDRGWILVYLDERAWVYVRKDAVDAAWLAGNGYTLYHPLNLTGLRLDPATRNQLVSELGRAVFSAPDYLQPRLDLALVYAVTGNYEGALKELESAKELAPDNPVVWNRIGTAALETRDHQRAIAAFRRLQQLAPDIHATWFNLGRAYMQAGEPNEAAKSLETAISLNPRFAQAYESLFAVHARSRRWAEAASVARRMANALPTDYRGFHYLAAVAFEQNNTSEAFRHAQKALQLNPRAAEVYLTLADAYARRKNFAAAMENVERALSIAPDNKAALDLRERLRSFQP